MIGVNDKCNRSECEGRYVMKFDSHYRLFKLVCDKCGFVEKYMVRESADERNTSNKI